MSRGLPVVLLAERDPFSVQQVKRALGGVVTLVIETEGQRAWEQVLAIHPDLVLAAVLLPDLDGYQLCRRIRGNPLTARTKVVLYSVLERTDVAMQAGADLFLPKPVEEERLRREVLRLLAQGRAA